MVSRICQEFGLAPGAAERELRRHGDLVTRVMELRHYDRCFHLVRRALHDEQVAKELENTPEGVDELLDLAFRLFATKGKG